MLVVTMVTEAVHKIQELDLKSNFWRTFASWIVTREAGSLPSSIGSLQMKESNRLESLGMSSKSANNWLMSLTGMMEEEVLLIRL
jgi:hypothetical protein